MGLKYTHYADSGGRDLERNYHRFHVTVCLIALEEGFEIIPRKPHFMRQGVRQQWTGLTVNSLSLHRQTRIRQTGGHFA